MEKLVSIKNARKAISQANEGVVERSRRIYVRGSRNDLRVPFREIMQDATIGQGSSEVNPPVTVYDTSGPYGDENLASDANRRVNIYRSNFYFF